MWRGARLQLALAAMAGLGVLVLGTDGSAADDPARETAARDQLDRIERSLDADRLTVERLDRQATAATAELGAIRTEMIKAAAAVQAQEARVGRAERQVAALAHEAEAKALALAARRQELAGTLAALQRLALRPPAALLVMPGDPNDVVRSGLLLRAAVPRIESRAAALRRDIDALAALRADVAEHKAELAGAVAALVTERDRLGTLVARKAVLLDRTREERRTAEARVAQLARQAVDLDELLTRLQQDRLERERIERVRREEAPRNRDSRRQPGPSGSVVAVPRARPGSPPSVASISDARGALTRPVQGQVIRRYGEKTDFGSTARGVTFQPNGSAQVVAPWDGQIVFSGEFADFGRILIIEHGEGYHSLLAGLERIDADVGQWVLSGEPVGIVGDEQAITPAASSGSGPTLYVELRRKGHPINPLPWLAASKNKVRG